MAASELKEGNKRGTMGFVQVIKSRHNRMSYALHRMEQNMSETFKVTNKEGEEKFVHKKVLRSDPEAVYFNIFEDNNRRSKFMPNFYRKNQWRVYERWNRFGGNYMNFGNNPVLQTQVT